MPLAGVRRYPLTLDFGNRAAVQVRYRAFNSGTERFAETIHHRTRSDHDQEIHMISPGATTFEMQPGSPGFKHQGYRVELLRLADSTLPIAVNSNPAQSDFTKFNAWIGTPEDYEIFLFVPPRLKGTQPFEVRHDTLNSTGEIDLRTPGWIQLGNGPFRMNSGRLVNSVPFTLSNLGSSSTIGPLKFVQTAAKKN